MNGLGEEHEGATARPALRDPVGLETIYEQHFDFVWRNLRRLGVREPLLRDAAQDVFVVVHRRLRDWDGDAVRSWLYSIVRRVAADTRRRQRRKEIVDRGDVQALADPTDRGPEHNAARNQELGRLLALLERLDEAKREALILVDLEGMSVPEVAVLLEVNVNTIYSRLRAARQGMREGLALVTGRERSEP